VCQLSKFRQTLVHKRLQPNQPRGVLCSAKSSAIDQKIVLLAGEASSRNHVKQRADAQWVFA